jgi:fucose permease
LTTERLQAAGSESPVRSAPAAYIGYALVGWCALLIPSLIRPIEAEFGASDSAVGVLLFVGAVAYALGALGGGLAEARIGRRRLFVASLIAMVVGLALTGVAPTWSIMLLAAVASLGNGSIDTLGNAIVLDLGPSRRSGALNLLHFCWSGGALCAPLVVGILVGSGVSWRLIYVGTAVWALAVVLFAARAPMPVHPPGVPETEQAGAEPRGREPRRIDPVIVLLSVGIACYVGAEIGVSSWLVRFLAEAPLTLATVSLSLFWAALTVARLVFSRIGDRVPPLPLAGSLAALGGIAIIGATVVPVIPIAIALFIAAGFAFGPIFPTIVSAGGARYPTRSAHVSGLLVSVAVIGAIVYPPVMGFVSDAAGLQPAMAGAGLISLGCALALLLAYRASGRRSAG